MKAYSFFLIFNLFILVLALNTLEAAEIRIELDQNQVTLRQKKTHKGPDPYYLKRHTQLPAGTIINVDPSNEMVKVLYNNDNDDLIRSNGSFFKVTILEIPGEENIHDFEGGDFYISANGINYKEVFKNQSIKSKTTGRAELRTRVFESSKLPKKYPFNFFLKKKISVPKGSTFTYDPHRLLEFPYFRNSSGKIKKSSGRYFGPLVFTKIPGKSAAEISQINSMKLYIFENKMNFTSLNKKLYSVGDQYDEFDFSEKVRWDDRGHTANWSKMAKSLVLENGVKLIESPPSDIDQFCPGYEGASDKNKAEFWVHLMAAIAEYESNFQPGRVNDESAFGSGQEDVVSRGLMQISYPSIRSKRIRENGCLINNQKELHHPVNNIQCGIALFNVLTSGSGKNCISCKYEDGDKEGKFAGIARYWSTLRPEYEVSCSACSDGTATIGHMKSISEKTKKLKICQ